MRSKTHPAVNIVNGYVRGVAVRAAGVNDDDEPIAGEGSSWDAKRNRDDERAVHPLIPLGAVNSLTESGTVQWPRHHLSRHCSRRMHAELVDHKHARERVLLPYLGAALCASNAGKPNIFTVTYVYKQGVQVGPWTYSCIKRERKRANRAAISSWFCIERQHVPFQFGGPAGADRERCWGPTQLLFGVIRHFAIVSTAAWDIKTHDLAGVELFYPCDWIEHTGLKTVNVTKPLEWKGAMVPQMPAPSSQDSCTICHVPLKHIKTQVGTAPDLRRHADTGDVLTPIPNGLVMLPLQR